MQNTTKQKRVKVGTSYFASGYGRNINKRNVWLIDGYCYAYHPEYARQSFSPLTGDLTGYIPVNHAKGFDSFYAIRSTEKHLPY